MSIQKITPFLWFDHEAEEAANFYVGTFNDARIRKITRHSETKSEVHGRPAGSVMVVEFEIEGQTFIAMNGGPGHPFTDATSFLVNCDTQAEIDSYWEKLSAGGREIQCGWLQDKYGVSWQVVPTILSELLNGSEQSARVMEALLGMVKLDIEALKAASQTKNNLYSKTQAQS